MLSSLKKKRAFQLKEIKYASFRGIKKQDVKELPSIPVQIRGWAHVRMQLDMKLEGGCNKITMGNREPFESFKGEGGEQHDL